MIDTTGAIIIPVCHDGFITAYNDSTFSVNGDSAIVITARSQQYAAFSLKLDGNWFLQTNTNVWVIGFYDKLVYFKNDFWQYKVVTKKENDLQILLQKGKKSFLLPVTINSDSTIKVTHNATALLLTNKRRRMAAEEVLPPSKEIKDTAFIKGYVDHRQLTSLKLMEFRVSNLILGNTTVQNATVDENGQFNLRLPLQFPSSLVIIEFGGVFEYVFMRPGDTAIVYIDILPYQNAKSADEIRNINCNMAIAGTRGAFNNEYRDYRLYVKRPDDYKEQAKMIRESDQNTYKEYELTKKQFSDSLVAAYRAQFTMSNLLWQTIKETNKYHLANSLYRYRWLHKPDKEVSLSAGYLNLVYSFTADDNYAHLAGFEFDGFIREVINKAVNEHLTNRKEIDSFITINSSLKKGLQYVQKNDKSLTEDLIKSIESLKEFGPTFGASTSGFSVRFSTKDSAEAIKFMQQYGHLMKFLDNNDYWYYYYSGMELLYGLSRIDSLFPKGIFRNYLLGHYLYTWFIENNRLNPDEGILNRIKMMCSDSGTYAIIAREIFRTKRQLEEEKYEDMVSSTWLREKETVINKIARENKGKVIYIDIWATWCGPCIEQFPYSKELQKHFEGKPVSFVYLCADSEKSNWQSSIKRYGLSGQHFFVDSDEISKLRARYNFSGYPRYMIINKEGRLVSSNALRPQIKEALISIIEDLLK
ncbi:TlpA family protein disulfide reductase [Niastella caeni]|uniref:TlpA family protein disulfide reductase n=1 Tax=Niastella caeni TaxID=2569763 RepID=UPI00140A00E1|nr:TlpA disulfide reductase family protein [Niastella caeni]